MTDIIASDPETGKMFRLEVKTRYDNKPTRSKLFGRALTWVMGAKHEAIKDPNLYYCFVNIEKEAKTFKVYIVPGDTVAKYVKEQHQFWRKETNGKDSNVRQFRLGLADGGYLIDTPLAKNYENNWDFS